MPQVYLRKYGVETKCDFELYETDGTDLKTDAVSASGDVTIYRDEAAEEQLDADAFVDEGKIYSLTLSAAEMNAARIVVCVVDQGTKTWLDKVFYVETYGNASAMHAFDLDTATVNLSAATETQIDNIEGDTNELQTDLTDGGRLDLLIDAILADTGELQTDWANGGRLDTLLDTTVSQTVAATVADAVLDEVVDANAPANANSLRETINVIVAAVAGKCSGVDTDTPTFRDLGDTKNRLVTAIDANDNRTASTADGT